MNKFKTSVIILNYNGEKFIRNCIASVLQQTYRDFEIIVADNNSIDNSVNLIKKDFKKEIENSNVKLIVFNKNYGFARGNNLAAKWAKGKYIVLLNNDTFVAEDWLEKLVKGIKSKDNIGIVSSKILFYDRPELIDSAGDGLSIDGVGFKRGHLQNKDIYNKDEYIFGACGAAVLYKKEVWEKLGGFDEDFFAVHEDTDFNFRAQLFGYKCLFNHDAIVYHRVNSSIGKYSYNYVYWTQRNNEYTYIKNMPARLIFKYVIFHILYNFISFIYFSFKGRAKAFLSAKFSVLKNLNKLLKKRRYIQRNIKVSVKYVESLMEKKWLLSRIRK